MGKAWATVTVALVLAAVLTVAQGSAGVAVHGFGVRQGSGTATLRLHDVSTIVARLLGLGVEVDMHGSGDLPSGDVFHRPKACLIVAVDGVSVEHVVNNKDTPYLSNLFNDSSMEIKNINYEMYFGLAGDTKVSKALSHDLSSLGTILHHQFKDSVVAVASGDKNIIDATVAKIGEKFALHEKTSSVVDELALFRTLPAALPSNLVGDENPDIIVLGVSSFRTLTKDFDSGLAQLDQAIPELVQTLNKLYDGRVATQVVLMDEPLSEDVKLNGEEDFSGGRNLETVVLPFSSEQIEVKLLWIWVPIVLIFFLILLFVCVQWADELDPILYSSLARDDFKKD